VTEHQRGMNPNLIPDEKLLEYHRNEDRKTSEAREAINKSVKNQQKNNVGGNSTELPSDDCGYMSRFRNIIEEHTDIPEKFTVAASYLLISETLGRFYKLKELEGYRPNLYIILASAPKITRRGSLTKAFTFVLETAFKIYYKELKNDKKLNFEIRAHMLEGGSPQGLVDDINYFRECSIESFAVRSTEFGKLFKKIYTGDSYVSGMDALLCKLWSGESYYESFSHRGKEKPEPRYLPSNQYFNLFGTMQKIEKYLTDKKVAETGLARRLSIWNVEGEELIDKHKPLLGRDEEGMYHKLEELGEELGIAMYQTHQKVEENNGELLELKFTSESASKFNELDRILDIKAKNNDDDPYSLYIQGQVDQALKFAMNRAISRNLTIIELEDFKVALSHAKISAKPLKPLFDMMKLPEKMKSEANLLNKMEGYFKKGKTRSEVQQRMSSYDVRKDKFHDYIETLLKEGRITKEQLQGKS